MKKLICKCFGHKPYPGKKDLVKDIMDVHCTRCLVEWKVYYNAYNIFNEFGYEARING